MKLRLSHGLLVLVAVTAAVAGAAGMYGIVELERPISSAPLRGAFSDVKTGRIPFSSPLGPDSQPYLNASAAMAAPSAFAPQGALWGKGAGLPPEHGA